MVDRLLDRWLDEDSRLILNGTLPRCYANLCPDAVAGPLMIDEIYMDFDTADLVRGKATVSATLMMVAEGYRPRPLIWCTDDFFDEFSRTVIAADSSGDTKFVYSGANSVLRAREFITYELTAAFDRYRSPTHFAIVPQAQVLIVGGWWETERDKGVIKHLFSLPRTTLFMRQFSGMAHRVIRLFRDTNVQMKQEQKAVEPPIVLFGGRVY